MSKQKLKAGFVLILNIEAKDPVFHAVGDPFHGLRTVCGKPFRMSAWELVRLPLRHAQKFSRPCSKCWEVE